MGLAAGQQVGPDFGFHQHTKSRRKMAHKTRHGTGVVIGQVCLNDLVAIDLQPRCPPGRRHAGQQDAVPGPASLQSFDQRLSGTGFAH